MLPVALGLGNHERAVDGIIIVASLLHFERTRAAAEVGRSKDSQPGHSCPDASAATLVVHAQRILLAANSE